jgi:hypothetical protein
LRPWCVNEKAIAIRFDLNPFFPELHEQFARAHISITSRSVSGAAETALT